MHKCKCECLALCCCIVFVLIFRLSFSAGLNFVKIFYFSAEETASAKSGTEMSSIAQQESLVKESLFQFVSKHIPDADLSVIDDIVLAYVISILEEASQDPIFDVEGFIEMMAAYLPKFSCIDTALVCSWIFELEAELSRSNDSSDCGDGNELAASQKFSVSLHSLSEMLPVIGKGERSHSNSESSDNGSKPRCRCRAWDACAECSPDMVQSGGVVITEQLSDQCQMLHEMFPNTCTMEIKHCISIARGDVERAAQTLLHRRENGQSLTGGGTLAGIKQPQIDDAELKNRIIARYSYVDKNSDQKEHKPLAPKIEPKKMVRYRDNKIVSLKGERYTEVPKSGADEDQLKKPKKQHCP